MFSAAFVNKINFGLTYLFICLFPCNEIVMKIGVCIFLQQIDMILFMVFMEKSRIYQIGRFSHRPSFNLTEIWNHATWLHDE